MFIKEVDFYEIKYIKDINVQNVLKCFPKFTETLMKTLMYEDQF